jgi:hypothetical protein
VTYRTERDIAAAAHADREAAEAIPPATIAVVGELVAATATLDARARVLELEFSAVKTDIIALLRADVDFLRTELARERSLRIDAVTALRAATVASV